MHKIRFEGDHQPLVRMKLFDMMHSRLPMDP